MRQQRPETVYGQRLLATAAIGIERLAASVSAHHARQAMDRLNDPDPRDEDKNG